MIVYYEYLTVSGLGVSAVLEIARYDLRHYPGIDPSGRATKNDEKYTYFIYILAYIYLTVVHKKIFQIYFFNST